MSQYFSRLAQRTLGQIPSLSPRTPALTEPMHWQGSDAAAALTSDDESWSPEVSQTEDGEGEGAPQLRRPAAGSKRRPADSPRNIESSTSLPTADANQASASLSAFAGRALGSTATTENRDRAELSTGALQPGEQLAASLESLSSPALSVDLPQPASRTGAGPLLARPVAGQVPKLQQPTSTPRSPVEPQTTPELTATSRVRAANEPAPQTRKGPPARPEPPRWQPLVAKSASIRTAAAGARRFDAELDAVAGLGGAGQRQLERSANSDHSGPTGAVHVHIGRIEVRGPAPKRAPAGVSTTARRAPALSLSAYLERRGRRGSP